MSYSTSSATGEISKLWSGDGDDKSLSLWAVQDRRKGNAIGGDMREVSPVASDDDAYHNASAAYRLTSCHRLRGNKSNNKLLMKSDKLLMVESYRPTSCHRLQGDMKVT